MISNLSIHPFAIAFLKVTCWRAIGLIWLVWTVSAEITDFVDVDTLWITSTPGEQFINRQQLFIHQFLQADKHENFMWAGMYGFSWS